MSDHSIIYAKVEVQCCKLLKGPKVLCRYFQDFLYLGGPLPPNASLRNDFFSIPSKTSCTLDCPRLP
jgi:hypothetical protein